MVRHKANTFPTIHPLWSSEHGLCVHSLRPWPSRSMRPTRSKQTAQTCPIAHNVGQRGTQNRDLLHNGARQTTRHHHSPLGQRLSLPERPWFDSSSSARPVSGAPESDNYLLKVVSKRNYTFSHPRTGSINLSHGSPSNSALLCKPCIATCLPLLW